MELHAEASLALRIKAFYANSPGLTCHAIARRLGMDPGFVCYVLGYSSKPPRSQVQREKCPHCGSFEFIKHGRPAGRQRYSCNSCWKTFFESKT